MAREIIYGADDGSTTRGADGVDQVHHDPRLEVQFSEAYVQIGIIPAGDEVDYNHDNGQFICLSRYGLNRLIRSVRKGRDRAYGADA